MINPGEEEYQDETIEQDEPQGSELDYKSEYEKTRAENDEWRQKYQRREADYKAQQGQLGPAQRELARLKKLEDSWKSKPKETSAEWSAFAQEYPRSAI